MGRRHLIVAAVAAAAVVAAAAAGAATITWKTVGDGAAAGPTVNQAFGYIALDRSSALAQLAGRLTPTAKARLAKVDFAHNALIAVFGEYGCNDGNVVTTAIVRHGATLTVKLVPRPPEPGTVTCQALFPTYRFLAVPLTALARPLPTRVSVDFA